MKFTAARKKFSGKGIQASSKKEASKKRFLKAQNLDIASTKDSSLEELQGLIGNQSMLLLLEEMGNVELVEGESLDVLEFIEAHKMNSTMQKRKEEEDMSVLIDNQKHMATDAVSQRSFGTKYTDSGKPSLKGDEWQKILNGFVQLVNVLKVNDLGDQEKEAKIREEDLLLNKDEELKRSDMALLITMIRKLPSFNGEKENKQEYFKVLRFMIAADINLEAILRATGHYEKQRNLIIKALGGTLAAESNDT